MIMAPEQLLIDFGQLVIVQALPGPVCLNPHPCLLPFCKMGRDYPCSPRPTDSSIPVVTKTSSITEPYTIYFATEVIKMIVADEYCFHISH